MVRRSQAQWHEVFREQEASGLNVAAFCHARGICTNYFNLRRRQLLSGAASDDTTAALSAFVPVAVRGPAETMVLEVRLGATLSLRVPIAVSPRWLVEVLHGLRA